MMRARPALTPLTRRRLLAGLGAAAAGALLPPGAARADGPSALERIRERGSLVVAVYNEMPPFHDQGAGIDVSLAEALAAAVGVKLSLLPFHADENMADDLRNMVWRGHYLGFGPADVLLHVPVDRPLIDATPQATIFAPYYRERVAIARNLERLPRLESLAPLAGQPVAVAGQSLAGWLLIGADHGALRETLQTRWPHGVAAAEALARGDVVAAAGLQSELETVLRGKPGIVIEPLPVPRAPRDGWAVGMAVKRASTDLARVLQAAVNDLAADGRLAEFCSRRNVAWRAA